MELIRQDRKTQQVNSEAGRHALQLTFDLALAVIVILASDGIHAEQETSANSTIHDVDHGNFVWSEYIRPSQSRH